MMRYITMRLPYKIILAIAFVLTALGFWQDAKYDIPSVPVGVSERILETVIMIPLSTGIIFGFLSGIYYTLFEDWKTGRRPKN